MDKDGSLPVVKVFLSSSSASSQASSASPGKATPRPRSSSTGGPVGKKSLSTSYSQTHDRRRKMMNPVTTPPALVDHSRWKQLYEEAQVYASLLEEEKRHLQRKVAELQSLAPGGSSPRKSGDPQSRADLEHLLRLNVENQLVIVRGRLVEAQKRVVQLQGVEQQLECSQARIASLEKQVEILKDWDPRRGLSVVGPHVEEVEPENGREEEVASLRKELACSLDLIDQAEIEMEWLRQEKFRAQEKLRSLHKVSHQLAQLMRMVSEEDSGKHDQDFVRSQIACLIKLAAPSHDEESDSERQALERHAQMHDWNAKWKVERDRCLQLERKNAELEAEVAEMRKHRVELSAELKSLRETLLATESAVRDLGLDLEVEKLSEESVILSQAEWESFRSEVEVLQGELEARNRDMQQQKLELEHVQLVCKSQNMQDRESLRHQRQVVQLERERVQACKELQQALECQDISQLRSHVQDACALLYRSTLEQDTSTPAAGAEEAPVLNPRPLSSISRRSSGSQTVLTGPEYDERISHLEATIQVEQDARSHAEVEAKKRGEALLAAQSQIQERDQQLIDSKDHAEELKKELEEQLKALMLRTQELQDSVEEGKQLHTKLQLSLRRVEVLQGELDARESDVVALQKRIDDEQALRLSCESSLQDMESQLREVRGALESLQESYNEEKATVETQQQELSLREATCKELQEELDESQELSSRQEEEIAKLHSRIRMLELLVAEEDEVDERGGDGSRLEGVEAILSETTTPGSSPLISSLTSHSLQLPRLGGVADPSAGSPCASEEEDEVEPPEHLQELHSRIQELERKRMEFHRTRTLSQAEMSTDFSPSISASSMWDPPAEGEPPERESSDESSAASSPPASTSAPKKLHRPTMAPPPPPPVQPPPSTPPSTRRTPSALELFRKVRLSLDGADLEGSPE